MKSATETSADLAAMRRPAAGNPVWRRVKTYQAINIVIVFVVLLVVVIVWSLLNPEDIRFATEGNFAILSQQIPITAIAAIGVGLLMISGEFDISVAGTFTLVPFVVAITFGEFGWPLPSRACSPASPSRSLIGLAQRPDHHAARHPVLHRHARHDVRAARRRSASSRSIPRPTSPTASPSSSASRSNRSSPAISSGRSTPRWSG